MAGDVESSGSDDAERETYVDLAGIARAFIAAVQGLPAAAVPDALCRACVSFLPEVSGLSLSVLGPDEGVGVVLFASDEVAALLAEIQYTLGEGPCAEAVRLRAPVFAPALTRAPDARRWPLFSVQAAKAGAEAVFSVPLPGAVGALGTLDLYRESAGALSREQVRTALLVADALSLAVAALGEASDDSDGVVTWLEGAESDREEIHQATGMIMVQLGVSAEEAVLRLRARAFAQGLTSTDVARAVLERTMDMHHE
ncbi:GAF and ANTAR domain-containing protein [Streptomyces sp. NPDC059371]|uniref:GAF and ANTAR domain-containing protein n=1 Tax=Streptomyces sp. NPDC059371 TaxID=3346812 RepID=UPI0036CF09F8